MWKRSENIVDRLFSRQISTHAPNTHIHRARGFYENVVPSHTVYEVDCPDQWWRRFTNDGQYLVCFSRSSQDVLLYRPSWLSYQSRSEGSEELPARANKFESYFTLLHRIPLATGVNEVICKDFFLATENNLYGIFATSTAPDPNAPAAPGAVAGVPVLETITFLIVRLADGVITARSVFRDDYIHLAHNAGVFLHDDLLAILSVRFQRIYIKQIREGGLFLDVRTIGEFCREDDELLLNSQAQEEAQYQEQATHRNASREVASASAQGMEYWGSRAFNRASERANEQQQQVTALAASPSQDLESAYEGYFRGLGQHHQHQHQHPRALDNVQVWRFVEQRSNHNSMAGRHLRLGGEYISYEETTFGPDVHSSTTTTAGVEALGGRGEYPAYESVLSRSSGSSDPSSHEEGGGAHRPRTTTRPVPTMFSDASLRPAESSLSQEVSAPGPSVPFSRPQPPGEDGNDSVVTGGPSQESSPQSGQLLGALKHRLLSFILQCILNDDTTPAIKAQRLKRFYYHFQHYVDLVMWKAQFLDRCHLLIKFGSVDGLVSRNSEASIQTAFLAIYNMETTDMLGFYQNSSEELLQCVERYCDHFRVAPRYPLYMNFISSYSNNSFAREQLQKLKVDSATSRAGAYAQVVKRTLASLPHNSQSQSPSPYFDQYLFNYDEKLISATDRHKPCLEHPIKFHSRRRPNILKFKINPGTEIGSNDGHVKRVASFFFHPIYPFAISVQQTFMQTTIVNFHFRK